MWYIVLHEYQNKMFHAIGIDKKLPGREYRQIGTFNSFMRRNRYRKFNRPYVFTEQGILPPHDLNAVNDSVNFYNSLRSHRTPQPVKVYKSIYEFFDHIKYDNKKKNFVD